MGNIKVTAFERYLNDIMIEYKNSNDLWNAVGREKEVGREMEAERQRE
jgi:hypothetical protein